MIIILSIPDVVNIDNLTASYMSIGNYSKEQAIMVIKRLKGKELIIILELYPWIANESKYETEWLPQNIEVFTIGEQKY